LSALKWWQKTTIYQIYPRSFKDSSGNGIGDLRGIISKLDHIQDLGFETIWISPFFDSPQEDWGYDVSDYYGIAPDYGDGDDVDALIETVHTRGMRILFDLVLNHTSDQHPWFLESRSSRDNPRRDWYIWRDGRGKRPPNNWKAIPGGGGWHYDDHTDQWYYASFLPFQPDLNFRNPEVKKAMLDVARFWLEKGVDGYRLDIFSSLYKNEYLRDNPFSPHFAPKDFEQGFFQRWKYTLNCPETFEFAKELRAVVDSYAPERMLIGEVFGSQDMVRQYIGEELDGLNLVFLWDLLPISKVEAGLLRAVIQRYESHYPAPCTPVYVLGNHDQKRILSKIGGDLDGARLLAMFQFTARGVPITYYGEEIGMIDGRISAADSLDPVGRRYRWAPQWLLDVLGVYVNRDGCRTPMQWTGELNTGFCPPDVASWLPVLDNCKERNVEFQQSDANSLMNTYKMLLRLRKEYIALQEGALTLLDEIKSRPDVLAYRREHSVGSVCVMINFGLEAAVVENRTDCQRVLYSIGAAAQVERTSIILPPYSGHLLI
jgi:glycosidase